MAHSFPCTWQAGFVMHPEKKQRVGYVCSFDGIGLSTALTADITVFCPFNADTAPAYTKLTVTKQDGNNTVNVVGVLDSVNWNGGVGDPMSFSCYMSKTNANLLQSLRSTTLKTTAMKALGFWICDFDEEGKIWYEQFYPLTPSEMTGQINAPNKNDTRLHIADDPVKVAPGIDVNVFNVYFEMVPAANQTFTFNIASSKTMKVAKPWGLIVKSADNTLAPAT